MIAVKGARRCAGPPDYRFSLKAVPWLPRRTPPPGHYALSGPGPLRFGDDCAPSLLAAVTMEINHYPVARPLKFVRTGRVGIESRELPMAARGVKHR